MCHFIWIVWFPEAGKVTHWVCCPFLCWWLWGCGCRDEDTRGLNPAAARGTICTGGCCTSECESLLSGAHSRPRSAHHGAGGAACHLHEQTEMSTFHIYTDMVLTPNSWAPVPVCNSTCFQYFLVLICGSQKQSKLQIFFIFIVMFQCKQNHNNNNDSSFLMAIIGSLFKTSEREETRGCSQTVEF